MKTTGKEKRERGERLYQHLRGCCVEVREHRRDGAINRSLSFTSSKEQVIALKGCAKV